MFEGVRGVARVPCLGVRVVLLRGDDGLKQGVGGFRKKIESEGLCRPLRMPPASKTPRVASPRGGSGASAASRSSGSKSARAAPAAGANPLGATLQRQPSKASVQQPQQFQPPPATVQQQKAATASATLGATSTGGGGTMVAAKALVIRTGFELSTPKMADLAAGTTVQVHETRRQPDGSIRARITLSGSTQGWCTSATKDGTLALHELGTSEATAAAEANQRQRRPGTAGRH